MYHLLKMERVTRKLSLSNYWRNVAIPGIVGINLETKNRIDLYPMISN